MRPLLPAASDWFPSIFSFGGVCLAVVRRFFPEGKLVCCRCLAALSAAGLRVEGVARPVTEEVEGDDDGRDDRGGDEEEEEVADGVLDRAVEHVAQRRRRVL